MSLTDSGNSRTFFMHTYASPFPSSPTTIVRHHLSSVLSEGMLIRFSSLVFLGPNAPISHGTTITENVSKYIMQMIARAQVGGIRTIHVKRAAVDGFDELIDTFMPRTDEYNTGNCFNISAMASLSARSSERLSLVLGRD
ncbi:hypothetical protein GQ53DRAFT_834730 [Thozetella sp. PMI_491]|nr:hypothetical protein GQ53DRAFT_834730 [Thozetella sp. PMI_491]